jgi:hypothetical protein
MSTASDTICCCQVARTMREIFIYASSLQPILSYFLFSILLHKVRTKQHPTPPQDKCCLICMQLTCTIVLHFLAIAPISFCNYLETIKGLLANTISDWKLDRCRIASQSAYYTNTWRLLEILSKVCVCRRRCHWVTWLRVTTNKLDMR